MAKTIFSIPLEQLGWKAELGFLPDREQGAVSFLVVAPWCPDCQEIGEHLRAEKPDPDAPPCWLVGEFAPASETLAFAKRHQLRWPVLSGTNEKSKTAINEAKFTQIRKSMGDSRTWGVPTWIQGQIKNGWLHVERVDWPKD